MCEYSFIAMHTCQGPWAQAFVVARKSVHRFPATNSHRLWFCSIFAKPLRTLVQNSLETKTGQICAHRNDSSLDFSTLQFFAFLAFAFFRIHGSCVVRCCGVCIMCFEVLRPLGFRVVDVLSSCRKLGFSHFEILGRGARRLPPWRPPHPFPP